jgi:hypothetical protein
LLHASIASKLLDGKQESQSATWDDTVKIEPVQHTGSLQSSPASPVVGMEQAFRRGWRFESR